MAWRKSSHSGNGGNCVELNITWQKSTRRIDLKRVEVATLQIAAA